MATPARPADRLAPGSSEGRVFELDFLRGIAVLLVLSAHAPALIGDSGWLRPLDLFCHQFGWSGVDLFFVLSGYLIGGLLFDEARKRQGIDTRRFLVRRMLRIWPAYYLFLAWALPVLSFKEGLTAAWAQLWPAFLNLQNYFGGGPPPRDHLWTLAVEEHFYLVLPLMLAYLMSRKGTVKERLWPVPFLGLSIAVVCLALRVRGFMVDDHFMRYPTHLSVEALFFGVLLAHCKHFRPGMLESIARRRWVWPVALLLMVPAAVKRGWVRETVGYTGLYLGYSLVLIRLVHGGDADLWLRRLLASRPARAVAFFGMSSYSIYLWHREPWTWEAYKLGRSLGESLGLPLPLIWLLYTTLYILAGLLVGVALDKLIETPILSLRNRLFPPRVVPSSQAATAPPEVSRRGGGPALAESSRDAGI